MSNDDNSKNNPLLGRDPELDQLLNPLLNARPNDLQLQKWKFSLSNEVKTKSESNKQHNQNQGANIRLFLQLAAAVFVGIVIGAVAFRNNSTLENQNKLVTQISLEDATYERSHANLD